jgi:Lrp/AsnC family leucine-responsive transcriptional regulator
LPGAPVNNAPHRFHDVSPAIETNHEDPALESKVTDATPELDGKDWQLLEALQRDARLGYAELGRKVRLSAPAVAERVKRLEEAGVITGYRAVVNPKRLGYGISAMIRLRCDGITCARIGTLVDDIPEVLECRRLAGEDSALLHVVAMSISHLESVLDRILKTGASNSTTTLIVFQTPHENRPLTRAMWNAAVAMSRD